MREGKKASRDVAIDNLDHCKSALVGHDIEGLSLDAGILVCPPFQIVLGQFGVGGGLGLFGDGLDGVGAIDGFLRAGDACEAGKSNREALARWSSSKGAGAGWEKGTHVDLSQFMMDSKDGVWKDRRNRQAKLF